MYRHIVIVYSNCSYSCMHNCTCCVRVTALLEYLNGPQMTGICNSSRGVALCISLCMNSRTVSIQTLFYVQYKYAYIIKWHLTL